LPPNVQTFLLNQSLQAILDLKFSQWGWTSSSNVLASTTLYSLLFPNFQSCVQSVTNLLSPISYDFEIDLTKLNNSFASIKMNQIVSLEPVEFFQEFYEIFEQYLPSNVNVKRNKKPMYLSVYSEAVNRALKFLNMLVSKRTNGKNFMANSFCIRCCSNCCNGRKIQ